MSGRDSEGERSPQYASATTGGASTAEPVPCVPKLAPEVSIGQTQDPILIPAMPEAYAVARELLNLSTPMSLVMQEGFQPVQCL